MFDINDPAILDDLRGGALAHLHHVVGLCEDQDREFVTAAVHAQFGIELQVISLGAVAPSNTWGLVYAPQTWRGKPKSVRQRSSEDDRGTLEGFVRGLNYCRRGEAERPAEVPAFVSRHAALRGATR